MNVIIITRSCRNCRSLYLFVLMIFRLYITQESDNLHITRVLCKWQRKLWHALPSPIELCRQTSVTVVRTC